MGIFVLLSLSRIFWSTSGQIGTAWMAVALLPVYGNVSGAGGRCSSERHHVSTFAPTELVLAAEEAHGNTPQIYLSTEGKDKWELCLNQTL